MVARDLEAGWAPAWPWIFSAERESRSSATTRTPLPRGRCLCTANCRPVKQTRCIWQCFVLGLGGEGRWGGGGLLRIVFSGQVWYSCVETWFLLPGSCSL